MVAMNVWPTDGAEGSVATEAKWRKMARTWAPSAVVDGIGGELKPTLAGTNLTIADGACWIDGHYAELTGPQVLTVTANGLAVVRFDPAANSAELLYRDGVTTPAQSPTGTFELPIAGIVGSALVDRRSLHADLALNLYTPTVNGYPQTSTEGAWSRSGQLVTAYIVSKGAGGTATGAVNFTLPVPAIKPFPSATLIPDAGGGWYNDGANNVITVWVRWEGNANGLAVPYTTTVTTLGQPLKITGPPSSGALPASHNFEIAFSYWAA